MSSARGMVVRRAVLASLATAALPGCAAPFPALEAGDTSASAYSLLSASADAHGAGALKAMSDISVSYTGQFRGLVNRTQPILVDEGFRGASQERLLLRDGLVAQAHAGPAGRKQVVRQWAADTPGSVQVWYDGTKTADVDRRHAAALVADDYALFLLGPMLLTGAWAAGRAPVLALAPRVGISQDGQAHECDVVRVRLAPGLGLSDGDQLAVYIDAGTRLMRRVRFTVDGLDGTRGAVAEVDTLDHVPFAGVQWPTRFHEQLVRPLPLPVHDWRLTGLDLNRGMAAASISGPAFTGRAADPATPWGRDSALNSEGATIADVRSERPS